MNDRLAAITNRLRAAWAPPKIPPAVEWIPTHIRIPPHMETPGRFDLEKFPHVRGVLEAVDDPMTRKIVLIFSVRSAKTVTSCAALLYLVSMRKRPGMLASSNEERADDAIDRTLYPLAEECDVTRGLLLPKAKRNRNFVQIGHLGIRRAFSGSPDTFAGFPVCYGVANEVAKWTTQASSEANAVNLFGDRFVLYGFDSKEIYESAPGKIGECQITRMAMADGVQRRWRYVPCPHCGKYQTLVLGKADTKAGLRWEKPEGAEHSDIELAAETAFYQCVNGCRIESEQRAEMMQAGVWLPEGCSIAKGGRIVGKPDHGPHTVAFVGLSVLYSLAIPGWGFVARKWLEACQTVEGRRNFVNSWMAEVWDPKPRVNNLTEIGERLAGDHSSGRVPEWGKLITIGVDVQKAGAEFVYWVSAWGDRGRGAEIAHGYAQGWGDLVERIIRREWPHADGGPGIVSLLTLVDSGDGNVTEYVYDLCRSEWRCLPCKGIPHCVGEWRENVLSAADRKGGARSSLNDVRLIEVNSAITQAYVQRYIDGETRPDDPGYELAIDSAMDMDLLAQICNEQKTTEIDKRGYERTAWERITPSAPNDLRDAWRYSRTAASIVTLGGKLWGRLPKRAERTQRPPKPVQASPRLTTPDGRPFLATER